ncbi:Nif3-like dinuclear metal center hexameric protein [Spirosoma daeguense]
MNSEKPLLQDVADFLKSELNTDHYPTTEQGGIYYPSNRQIQRIGLALQPFPTMAEWVDDEHIDAIWLHRPWQLKLDTLPADVGILSHHLPFDERLAIGYNKQLAKKLGAAGTPEPIGYKQSSTETGKTLPQRPLGMIIDVAEGEFDNWLKTINELFGGYDRAEAGNGTSGWQPHSSRIAIVGAMTDSLVREAAERNAHMYLTGDYRKPAQPAVDATGMAIVSVGHRRSELCGLPILADLLREKWPIDCLIYG